MRSRPLASWSAPLRRWAGALLAAVALLSGCLEQVAGVGGEGTGKIAAVGRVEGFGSVIVAGVRYDDTQLRVVQDLDPSRPVEVPLSDLRPGMVVRLSAEDGAARELSVAPELAGSVSAVDAANGRLTVAGQRVQINAVPADPTIFEGFRAVGDLQPGDRIEVHGERDGAATVRASFIRRADALAGTRVAGVATQTNAAAGTLRIGALTVRFADALRLPAGAAVADGDRVAAWGSLDRRGELLADALQVLPAAPPDGADWVRVAGLVTEFVSSADFRVNGLRVDASQAELQGAGALAAGRLVFVEGRPAGGVLAAQRLRLRDDSVPPQVEVRAAVADFVDSAEFRLRGVAVDASSARFRALRAANLGNGVRVAVAGRIDGAVLRADAVNADAPSGAADVVVSVGETSEIVASARRFKLIGLEAQFRLADNVVFEGGDITGWQEGVRVELRSRLQGGEQVVERLRYADAGAAVRLTGVAGNVEAGPGPGQGAFDIGPVDLLWDTGTVFLGATNSAADLVSGRAVRVQARWLAGVLVASQVDARVTQPGTVRLRGTVTAYASLGDFRIDGQRVDARNATFDPPTLAGQLAGAYIDVEGTLVGGVLQATRVSDP